MLYFLMTRQGLLAISFSISCLFDVIQSYSSCVPRIILWEIQVTQLLPSLSTAEVFRLGHVTIVVAYSFEYVPIILDHATMGLEVGIWSKIAEEKEI